jgi:hypothetical protein
MTFQACPDENTLVGLKEGVLNAHEPPRWC